ncbi:hypothetical protein [Nocardiopsis listeri]|uniref:hypothetical protein n=1 Tax=Nocardiopsis listeri TaxID=53440 RepID=UPI00083042C0|nr:hypothetical protein [Nocardiopsis listeri]
MKLVLSDHSTIEVTPAMLRSLREATLVPGTADSWLPGPAAPSTEADLIRWGLLVNDSRGTPVLTTRAMEVRERVADGSPGTAGSGDRASIDPELGMEGVRRLASALNRVPSDGDADPAPSDQGPYRPLLLVLYALGWCALLRIALPGMSTLLSVLVCVFAVLSVGGSALYTQRRNQETSAADPRRIVAEAQGRYVVPGMLDEPAVALLTRTQRAVDTVLGSRLSDEVLRDPIRDRVVLGETEWALATALRRQSELRGRMDVAPTAGGRGQEAAERAADALARDVARAEERIRLLERYADLIRAAEAEERDLRAARELDGIAVEAVGAEAGDPELEALVRAQEMAMRVAELPDLDRD